MKNNIKIFTNLDKYKTSYFPILNYCPRVGEYVRVINSMVESIESKGLPTSLIVVSITHTEFGAMVELYYSETQLSVYNLENLF
jgi:hypothetical protein